MRSFRNYFSALVLAMLVGVSLNKTSQGSELQEPFTLSSSKGILDLLMIAKAAPITSLPAKPVGWVYEICHRPSGNANACPAQQNAPNYYGGTLLRLSSGDLLRIHLINQLPPETDSKHALEPDLSYLSLNPTNLHTHGMLVSPNGPTPHNPTYGDNVFVLTFNSSNGQPGAMANLHSDIRYDFTDYEIRVPIGHPSGLFWFHPHVHGVALNQISAGLGGIMTVGNISDYVCRNRSCADTISKIGVRHLVLKDTQVLSNDEDHDQEDPGFCSQDPASNEPPRRGSCPGVNGAPGTDYTNGNWFFTINGQQFPTIPVRESGGEIWRITNVSGSVTYRLNLQNLAQGRNMLFQVLSMDGVSVSPTASMSGSQQKALFANRLLPEACPSVPSTRDFLLAPPICTRTLLMLPSSRAEIWVTYRDGNDDLRASPALGETAVLRTTGYTTGQTGDHWPAIDLARVEFPVATDPKMPAALGVNGEALALLAPLAISASLFPANAAAPRTAPCPALPPGHIRRIFFGVPSGNPDAFGLAYEELDANGITYGPSATDLIPFDPANTPICVPLGPFNLPVSERWQLINVATENHNFHIHQTKFRLVTRDELAGTATPKGVLLDNVPLPTAQGTCGADPLVGTGNPIADWRIGLCQTTPITVEIPFAIAGDFVYHCHILEHEDGGMMARIHVQPNR